MCSLRRNRLSLQVGGQGGVPASGVSAVVLNVTVTQPTASGYVTVWGDGTTRPTASNLNFAAGATVSSLVVTPVGATGKVDVYNGSAGSVQLIADVSGYYLAEPATVSADALPTVQLDGVVWSEVTVGNTVYATGSFTQTWPAGKPKTSANDTARGNLLAFDITTGNLTSFNHTLNAQGLVVTASPDGSRVYVGGQFTTVDGQSRPRLAAFDTATGALVPATGDSRFAPTLGSTVRAIAATNTTVYAGGDFTTANGNSRVRLAAFAAGDGALLSSWAPGADATVESMVLAPDQRRVIVGGHFTTLNGANVYGLGALDATTGATLPFAANSTIRDYGPNAAITSLTADATQVYATGYAYLAQTQGNFEGTAALDPNTGVIIWVDDCHGDTYGTFPIGQVLYSVGHAHDCSAIGDFPDTTSPRVSHRSLAETTYSTGTNKGPDGYGYNYNEIPDSTVLHWYPRLVSGTYTGQGQAAWSVTGNASYIAMGGEFPTVNGVAQHSLVRFAVRSLAPNRKGPISDATSLTPKVVSSSKGTARVTWKTTWDYDNQLLTYEVFRDGASTPTYTTTAKSSFWQLATLTFTDAGLTSGSTHSYLVKVYDPYGNTTDGPVTSLEIR